MAIIRKFTIIEHPIRCKLPELIEKLQGYIATYGTNADLRYETSSEEWVIWHDYNETQEEIAIHEAKCAHLSHRDKLWRKAQYELLKKEFE